MLVRLIVVIMSQNKQMLNHMVMGVKSAYCGGNFCNIYNVESYDTPETNIILFVNYTSI